MEYWNNPIKKYKWPCAEDPVVESFHNGQHCLFYNPAIPIAEIKYNTPLIQYIKWANDAVHNIGIDNTSDQTQLSKILKINLLVEHIQAHGIVKPILVYYTGSKFVTLTGDGKLRALECLPNLTTTVPVFITTATCYKDRLEESTGMMPIRTFNEFAGVFDAKIGQQFLFTLTDSNAPYGMYWYEYASPLTANVTPDVDDSIKMLKSYFSKHLNTQLSVDWFTTPIDWSQYQ